MFYHHIFWNDDVVAYFMRFVSYLLNIAPAFRSWCVKSFLYPAVLLDECWLVCRLFFTLTLNKKDLLCSVIWWSGIATGSSLILRSVNFTFKQKAACTHHRLLAREWPGSSYLCFSKHEWGGHLEAFGSGQILVQFELVLQLQQLLTCEGGAGPPTLSQKTRLRARWRSKSKDIKCLASFTDSSYFTTSCINLQECGFTCLFFFGGVVFYWTISNHNFDNSTKPYFEISGSSRRY